MRHTLTIYGTPGPQGSKDFKGFSRAGKAKLIESSPKLKPWRDDITTAIAVYLAPLRPGWIPIATAQIVRMIFTLPKPKASPKTIRIAAQKYPDLDKLARGAGDALTQAGLIRDDALIVEYSRLAKVYPGEDPEALQSPGAVITLNNWLDAPIHPDLMCPSCGGFVPTHKCPKKNKPTQDR